MNEIAAYSQTKLALAGLRSKYLNVVYDVTTVDGMADAKAAKKEIASHRITLEAARVKEKADSLARGKQIDAEAKPLAAEIAALEDPVTAMIETETKRELREREAAVKAELDRIQAEAQAKKEAEERALAEERAKLAAERAAIEKERREAAEMMEAGFRASRQKIEDEERASRAKREEADAEAKRLRQIEEDRLRAERAKIDAEARVVAEAQRKVQADGEAKAAEQRRAIEDAERAKRVEADRVAKIKADKLAAIKAKADELLGAEQMLATFRTRYGHLPQFAGVVAAIYLAIGQQQKAA